MEIKVSKRSLKMAGIVLFLLVAGFVLYTVFVAKGPIEERHPDDHYIEYRDGRVGVNGSGFMNGSDYMPSDQRFQVIRDDIQTKMTLFGVYNGNYFAYGSYPEGAEQPVMELDPELAPDNGVINGYMIGTIRGSGEFPTVWIDIYVDEEFRNATGYETNIVIWDSASGYLEERVFQPEEIADGIYRQELRIDSSRAFQASLMGVSGIVMVGDVGVSGDSPRTGAVYMGLS